MYLSLAVAEGLADEIGILDSHIEERTFPGGEVMRHGSLVEMTAVVEFVAVDLLPAVGAPPSGETRAFVGDSRGQIAVRFLRGSYKVNHAVEIIVELLVIFHSEGI